MSDLHAGAASLDSGTAPETGRRPTSESVVGSPVTLARTREELTLALDGDSAPRAVVMTMGALHQGHLDLVDEAAQRAGAEGTVVVTIFVNPLQFAAGEDLDAYPRTLEADVSGITGRLTRGGGLMVGRLVVFAPTPEVIYPDGEPGTRVVPGPLATVLEGVTRPTHFAGVLQVVLALLHLTQPRWAVFGRKDAQQLAVVRAMVRDLAVPVEIVPVDIRRETDGLAMSSRNVYLTGEQRQQALALSQALEVGRVVASQGAGAAGVRQAALEMLGSASGVEVDYVALVDPDSFEDLAGAGLGLPAAEAGAAAGEGLRSRSETASGDGDGSGAGARGSLPLGAVGGARQGLLAVAAKVGSTRLIDNTLLWLA